MYNYLIVGSGLYGAVFAHEAMKRGKTVLVVEKRSHVGGNIYTENVGGINVHKYGAVARSRRGVFYPLKAGDKRRGIT